MVESHNPYTAPSVAVKDAPPDERRRPVSLYVALALIGVHLALSVIGWMALMRWRHMMNIAPSLIYWPLVKWVVLLFTGLMIWRGHNWARMLYLAIALLLLASKVTQFWWSILQNPQARDFIHQPVAMLGFFLEPVLALLAAYLLLFPARRWFTGRAGDAS